MATTLASQSTMRYRVVVVHNGQPQQALLLPPDAYFCRVLCLSAGILRVGLDGFLNPQEEELVFEGEEQEYTADFSGAQEFYSSAAADGMSSSSDGLSSRASLLEDNHLSDDRGSPTSTGHASHATTVGDETEAAEAESGATGQITEVEQIVGVAGGTPEVDVKSEGDEVQNQHPALPPSLDDDSLAEGSLMVNHDGKYPREPEDPESFRNSFFAVRRSPLGGFGAFARRDLAASETILVERALFSAGQITIYDALERLAPAQLAAYFRLHGHVRIPSDLADGKRYAIFRTNSFAVPPTPTTSTSSPAGLSDPAALFLVGSRFNHACRPRANVGYRYDAAARCMAFATERPVRAGDELTISYSCSPLDLYGVWGFRCACGPAARCPTPSAGPPTPAPPGTGRGGGGGPHIWG